MIESHGSRNTDYKTAAPGESWQHYPGFQYFNLAMTSMTVRTKQELIDRAAVLFPDQGDPLIHGFGRAAVVHPRIWWTVSRLTRRSLARPSCSSSTRSSGRTIGRTRPSAAPASRSRRCSRRWSVDQTPRRTPQGIADEDVDAGDLRPRIRRIPHADPLRRVQPGQ